jgi:hypothetical protein
MLSVVYALSLLLNAAPYAKCHYSYNRYAEFHETECHDILYIACEN